MVGQGDSDHVGRNHCGGDHVRNGCVGGLGVRASVIENEIDGISGGKAMARNGEQDNVRSDRG